MLVARFLMTQLAGKLLLTSRILMLAMFCHDYWDGCSQFYEVKNGGQASPTQDGVIQEAFRCCHLVQYTNKVLRFHGVKGPRSSIQ